MIFEETDGSVMENCSFVLEQKVLLLNGAVRSFGFQEGFVGGLGFRVRFGFAGFGFILDCSDGGFARGKEDFGGEESSVGSIGVIRLFQGWGM